MQQGAAVADESASPQVERTAGVMSWLIAESDHDEETTLDVSDDCKLGDR